MGSICRRLININCSIVTTYLLRYVMNEEEIRKSFGDKVRAKRKEINLAQDKLAYLAEIDRSYVGKIERGLVNITITKAYKLAEVLECSIHDLMP
jgi:DNA-binding XRE family transcriptional regulator